ncbi:MAG: D-alanyl-D-alanine carboxypeptidase [Pseudanabaenaceae cyanobacterium SKYGB_i_bin29]|nr:D-alanyl-D-alanine carboxypeptidase [Pseudanabaenaceae cyanobacterium SKYG29]MDW8420268.1 D-alanyl-D-alanine carboxypeptidase [Pseudanabaenaceae cyanobacterium SKYGB_i_bin29]
MWGLLALWLWYRFPDRLPVVLLQTMSPVLAQGVSDSVAGRAVEQHLATLERYGYPRSGQGVWIQSQEGELLASHQGDKPLPVASLTKIATTLAVLSTWHSQSQFITQIATDGQLVGDTLQGNLIIVGGGDPLFVWEDGIRIGNKLQTLGIRQVTGDLVVTPGFYMNFTTDRLESAQLFRQAIDSSQWQGEVLTQYQTLPAGTPRPQITIKGGVRLLPQARGRVLLKHRSLPLWYILKQMNIYSNNVIADVLMANLGGAQKVTDKLVAATGLSRLEIRLVNGSGLGQANQISPRGVVALLLATQQQARSQGLSLADLFPMGNCRCGTIQDRRFNASAVLKTGTLSDVSSLAGIIQTKKQGTVWFALINRGEGDIAIFHRAQEAVLGSLYQQWGEFPLWQPRLAALEFDRDEIMAP